MGDENKEFRNKTCQGTVPGTNIKCGEILFQSDGEVLMIGGLVVNDHLDEQRVGCPRCGYTNVWRRHKKFRRKNR